MEKVHIWVATVGSIWNDIVSVYASETGNNPYINKDEMISRLISHDSDLKQKYKIQKWSYVLDLFDYEHDHTLGAKSILSHIENKLISTDHEGRVFIVKSILRDLRWMLDEGEVDYNQKIISKLHDLTYDENMRCFMGNIHTVMSYFAGYFSVICTDLNIDVVKVAPYTTSDKVVTSYKEMFLASTVEQSGKNYKTIDRSYAIAAVNTLLSKLGVFSTVDKTKIAEFVEAVTGGNINTVGKNTFAYKEPSKMAKEAASELLKKINM